jgi:hypothetical protein
MALTRPIEIVPIVSLSSLRFPAPKDPILQNRQSAEQPQ